MIFSEAMFDAAQASLVQTSNIASLCRLPPLIPFVHCLTDRAGRLRPNKSLEPTRMIIVPNTFAVHARLSSIRYAPSLPR